VPVNAAPNPDRASWRFQRRWLIGLGLIFALALAPRLFGALSYGFLRPASGIETIVNADQNNSCRSVLGSFRYPSFVGRQVIWLGTLAGHAPPAELKVNAAVKEYCQSPPLIRVGRCYAAVTGALTAALLALMGLLMWPARPQIGWTAGALLALSNLHVTQSHWATVDVPQVFFTTLLSAALLFALVARRRWPLLLSPLLLALAFLTKAYAFAAFAYAGHLRRHGLNRKVLGFAAAGLGVVGLALLIAGSDEMIDIYAKIRHLLWGHQKSTFGTGYGTIGVWRRWLRNGLNLPLVHLVGIGIPACLFLYRGLRDAIADRERQALWLVQAPAAVFAAYMLLLAPVTYYRHYLHLFPVVCLLAAYGFWQSRWARHKALLALFLIYPALLTVDAELGFYNDPRGRLGAWSEQHGAPRVFATHYAWPPSNTPKAMFDTEQYRRHGLRYLSMAKYLVTGEAWYGKYYANELNGPFASRPERLIKTRPEEAKVFRAIIEGRDPNLVLDTEYRMRHFMPELMLHRALYGSFSLFLGDVKIFRVVGAPG